MPRRDRRVLLSLPLTLVMTAIGIALAAPAEAAATTNAAFWSMDEPPGSSTMVDSSGNGINGSIGPDVQTGVLFDGATAYRFPDISPTAPPARPEHIVTVPSTSALNPDTQDYAVTIRYRTTKSFGNVAQKGQNKTAGGYWKFEQPNGYMTCLFKGSNGEQRAVKSKIALNDGQWHVRCERTAAGLTMYVDGVRNNYLAGTTGTIANTWELSIGGRSRCDQIKVTCDYFVGDIDYVRVEKGSSGPSNQPPTAAITGDCAGMACSFSGAGSTDSDGAIQTYAWDFGDGATANTGSVSTVSHTYTTPGSYTASLTVTDDRGATSTATMPVSVAPAAEVISFVDQASANANATTHRVTVPSTVQPGDGLLLFFSENTHATIGDPTGVTGWLPLTSLQGGSATTEVWRKVAAADDAGKTLAISLSAQSKGSLIVVAYRGTSTTDPVAAFADATDTTKTATRITPYVQVTGASSWAVSYWMHGDGTTTALVPPPGVTPRATGTQSGGGRVTTLLADSAASVPIGTYGGLAATAAAASTTTTTWTVILAPQG